MKSVSFILNGNGVTPAQIRDLEKALDTLLSKYSLNTEYFFYSSQKSSHASSSRFIGFIDEESIQSSLQRSIVTAGGEWLVFTTPENALILSKNINLLSKYLDSNLKASVIAPAHTNFFTKLVGLRHFTNTPFIAARKPFLIQNITLIHLVSNILKLADKSLQLGIVPTSGETYPSATIKNLTIIRPYHIILKHAYTHAVRVIKEKQRQRKAEKLRKQVLPVPYSTDIPVFIICRDRVEPLKRLVVWLEEEGLKNIYFIDNASTYPPLLEYFQKTSYNVIRLNINSGHTSPWKEGIVQLYAAGKPFIVTDPDVIPSDKAHGAVRLFAKLLDDHPERTKAGFGLRIDNLPAHYELRDHVISWEKQFWVSEVEPEVYDAEIDTTFALYRPGTPYTLGPGLRTGGKYIAEHEPWYVDSKHVPAEIKYYREHADKVIGSWGVDLSEVTSEYSKNHLHQTTENNR